MKQLERGPDAPYYVFAVPKGEIPKVRTHLVVKGYDWDASAVYYKGKRVANVIRNSKPSQEAAFIIHVIRESEKADGLKAALDSFDPHKIPF